jgi:hypothetical protein
MVNGWLPDEQKMEVGAVADWYRAKLERLVKYVEVTAQEKESSGSRFGNLAAEGVFPGGEEVWKEASAGMEIRACRSHGKESAASFP